VKRLAFLLSVAAATAALCAAATASRLGTPLRIGAVVPELTVRELVGSTIEDMTKSNLDGAGRVTLTWKRGQTTLDPGQVSDLGYAADQAAAKGIEIYVSLYPEGANATPRTPLARVTFAKWAASIAKQLPGVTHFIIGNEPNLNRFWLPQFGRGGTDVAAPAYELLLARTYDAIKAVAPSDEVIGGALAHAGVNKRGSGRDTQAPTRFILDLGKAYRETKRKKPIMDAFAFHPYLEHANLPPTYKHYSPRIITIADYGRLISVLGRAFDGTGQKGSKIPIVYAEFGVESRIPEALLPAYTGTEPATTRPVSESTQAKFYAKAMQMAACQPTVTTFFVFRLIDEQPRGGWQSGLFYFNGSPKASLEPVSLAAARLEEFGPSGCAALLQPQPKVTFFPGRKPSARFPTVKPIGLLCDADCTYDVRLLGIRGKVYGEGTGKVIAGTRIRVGVGDQPLARGTYRLAVRVTANAFKANPFKKTVTFTF
jgi:hypothetical protein